MSMKDRIDRVIPPLPGWCTPEKALRMAELVVLAKATLCVELGVFGARGLIAMAIGLQELGLGKVDGIDPFTKAAALEGTNDKANDKWWSELNYETIFAQAYGAIEKNGLLPFSSLVRKRSQDAVADYADETIDVLHQDSNHSFEVSTAEVMAWLPKLKEGGYWIQDDTDWPSTRHAQDMLVEKGCVLLEDHQKWKVFQKAKVDPELVEKLKADRARASSPIGSEGGPHLGGAILDNGGDANTWMPDIWNRLIVDYQIRSVIDIGCGAGFVTKWFRDNLGDAVGVEGDPTAWSQRQTDAIVLHDYAKGPYTPTRGYDLGWCAEFVEHVDEKYIENWMATLQWCRYVAMTFAKIGQGGHHHVNEQEEPYWLKKFSEFGFSHVSEETQKMRATSKGETWGRPTLTFFKNDRFSTSEKP